MTTSPSRGISTETFLRLWTRAPCTAIVVRADTGFGLWALGFGVMAEIEARELVHVHVTLLREPRRRRRLADDVLIGEVLAGGRHPLHVERPLEVVFHFAGGPRVPRVTQVVDDWREHGGCSLGDIALRGLERRLYGGPCLLRVE